MWPLLTVLATAAVAAPDHVRQAPLTAPRPAADVAGSGFDSGLGSGLGFGLASAARRVGGLVHDLATALDRSGGGDDDDDEKPRGTIYELVRGCKHTARFADLVDRHHDVVELLNRTDAAYTLFVPTNEALDHRRDGGGDDDTALGALLRYHIAPGTHPAHRLLLTNTLPTALQEKLLGDEPQRLRTSIGFSGLKLNFYSSVVAADIKASNGVIHAVNHVLVPPPLLGHIIALLPGEFSTLLLAFEKTDFVSYVHGISMVGSTVFAPSNAAFARLGVKANVFLFNTETGRKCLRGLLKYHVSPNITLYSDAIYDKTAQSLSREHYELPTLLGDTRVAVDFYRWGKLSAIRVNGFAHISWRDGVSKNGVIQVVDQVLLPPKRHGDASETPGDISVQELQARLEPYI